MSDKRRGPMPGDSLQVEKHIFQRFDDELGALLDKFLQMGGLVEKQVADAIKALTENDVELAAAVRVNEDQVDDLDVQIDQMCVRMIAIRQPTASDLRLILSIGKSVQDLERIGDEANKIAKLTLALNEQTEAPQEIGRSKIRHLGQYVTEMLRLVLDAYGRLDAEVSITIARTDEIVDEEYRAATRELITYMMEDPRAITAVLNVMWALRSLERVGDHVENLSEHLIYTVKGIDVRHTSLNQIRQQIK